MREILFKAKRIDNGEWVEGHYAVAIDKRGLKQHKILVADHTLGYFKWFVIDEKTLCQYTGLTDANGYNICENDVVYIPREDEYFKIEWEEDKAMFVMNGDGVTVTFDNYWPHEVEVYGSAFDVGELLGGAE